MDLQQIRQDFPILGRKIYDKYPLVYLDNGATTQKPLCVLDAMREEYLNVNANVHRGVHYLSQQATDLHEEARETVRQFINARKSSEIVFTRGTTESLNLVASSFTEAYMKKGDEVIISTMEHHSNIVPWQLQADRMGLVLKVIPLMSTSGVHPEQVEGSTSTSSSSSSSTSSSTSTSSSSSSSTSGILDLEAYKQLFTERTKLVSVTHVSNVLGTVNPVKEIVRIAHEHGVPCMIDGAQSTPHVKIDVQDIDCDFFAFSGHKMYGPTGIGVLYGKEQYLEEMPPYQGGGDMIGTVSFEKTTYAALPYKFEAGTPDYIATHGLAKAIEYMQSIGMENIEAHERELTAYALEKLQQIPGMTIFGPKTADRKDAVISFLVKEPSSVIESPSLERDGGGWSYIHHLDMGTLLDRLGIAVRTGHHCAEPLMHRLGIQGTVRASFGMYNTKEEVDALVSAIKRVSMMF